MDAPCVLSIPSLAKSLRFRLTSKAHDDPDCDRQMRPVIAADARFGTILTEAGISAGCPRP
jgi:hypothetical protein